MKVWLDDGRVAGLVDADAARVSVFDHGLTVGDGVFETLKVVDGRPFALSRHLERLARSARGLGLAVPDAAGVRVAVAELLAAQPRVPLARLRITVTGGVAPLGSARGDRTPTLIVATAALPAREESTSVATVPWTRNDQGALTGLKTTSYAENVVALARARQLGASEAVLANSKGQLCEGTGSNVFLEVDGRIVTPTLASGCLAGVTRALVCAWCDVEERDVPLAFLYAAREVFLTSTTRDVQPVHAVDGRSPTAGAPGPLTVAVLDCFAARSAEDFDP